MHPRDAKGAGYARSIAMSQYGGEDYYLQIDSHTIFEKNWDIECIDQHNSAKLIARNDKVILSYFPAPFHIEPNKHCLLYTSPSPRDRQKSRMPSSA